MTACFGMPSLMSTRDRMQLTHKADGLTGMTAPHSQQSLHARAAHTARRHNTWQRQRTMCRACVTTHTNNESQPQAQQVNAAVFMAAFNRAVKAAGINLHFGTHCFRVGGVNTLQDMGVGPAEIMAMGRWASDVWSLYARRNRMRLLQHTNAIADVAGGWADVGPGYTLGIGLPLSGTYAGSTDGALAQLPHAPACRASRRDSNQDPPDQLTLSPNFWEE